MMGRNGQRMVEGRCKGGIPISDMVRSKALRGKGGELRAAGNCEKVGECVECVSHQVEELPEFRYRRE